MSDPKPNRLAAALKRLEIAIAELRVDPKSDGRQRAVCLRSRSAYTLFCATSELQEQIDQELCQELRRLLVKSTELLTPNTPFSRSVFRRIDDLELFVESMSDRELCDTAY